MKRKFKLVKTYPGSPELGKVLTQVDDIFYHDTSLDKSTRFRNEIVENHPQFWQEIKEKDWEILSFRDKMTGDIIEQLPNGLFSEYNSNSGWAVYEDSSFLENSESYHIHSVKRTSDGKIFTLGDKVKDPSTAIYTNNSTQVINYFYPGEKIICQAESGTTFPLSGIEKVQPILTTEDAVDIFGGDKFYYIGDAFNVCKTTCLYKGDGNFSKFKTFSTKEAAEKYIELNKPRFSLKDLREVFYMYTPISPDLTNDIIELLKKEKK